MKRSYNRKEEVLEYIRRHPGLSAARYNRAFRSNLYGTLRKLEEVGFIRKEENQSNLGWPFFVYYPL